jgi:hypothetical protein
MTRTQLGELAQRGAAVLEAPRVQGRLRRSEALRDPALARALLADIDSNLPTIRRPAARLLAMKARGDLLFSLERTSEACAQFDRVRKLYAGMPESFRTAVDFYYTEDSGPACQ